MTGFRGEPCIYYCVICRIKTGEQKDICSQGHTARSNNCPIGSYCPIAGDPKYHIVKEIVP